MQNLPNKRNINNKLLAEHKFIFRWLSVHCSILYLVHKINNCARMCFINRKVSHKFAVDAQLRLAQPERI